MHIIFQAPKAKKKLTNKYRQGYTPDNLTRAYRLVQSGMSKRRASHLTGVPRQTLCDRLSGLVRVNRRGSGVEAVFTEEEEKALVQHVSTMAAIGYGYTRMSIRVLATDTAKYLNKASKNLDAGKFLSDKWLTGFLHRNPDLKVKKPRALDIIRAKSLTPAVVENYFHNLKDIMDRYGLHDKPHLIYNIDETNLSPNHVPRRVIAQASAVIPGITSPRGATTTLIGACSASGQFIPPFYVFKGVRRNSDLMKGKLSGSDYRMSKTGWSNSVIFQVRIETNVVSQHHRLF